MDESAEKSTIWNDHFILADRNWEVKLAFSHGLAQSAKLTVFEVRPSPRWGQC